MLKRIITSCLIMLAGLSSAQALDLQVTEGSDLATPIAVIPFKWEGNGTPAQDVGAIIGADLRNSGQFTPLTYSQLSETPASEAEITYSKWMDKGANNMVTGSIKQDASGNYVIHYQLIDLIAGEIASKEKNGSKDHILLDDTVSVPADRLREYAHRISDLVYEELTGVRGAFLTRIAFIARADSGTYPYQLKVADYDGYNESLMIRSRQPLMSPAWSPSGQHIAYVSFESGRSQLYLLDVYSGKKEVLTSYPGHNGAPKFSPDGQSLAIVLSKTGKLQVYILDLKSRNIRQITYGNSNNTEPSWAPDGRSLVFTSDRGGNPQIYRVDIASGATQRLTMQGRQNLTGQITPDGKHLVMVHQSDKGFNIATQDLETDTILILTESRLDESPSLAPNGSMIIYSTIHGSRNVLSLVSFDGRFQALLPMKNGRVKSPAWSSFLN